MTMFRVGVLLCYTAAPAPVVIALAGRPLWQIVAVPTVLFTAGYGLMSIDERLDRPRPRSTAVAPPFTADQLRAMSTPELHQAYDHLRRQMRELSEGPTLSRTDVDRAEALLDCSRDIRERIEARRRSDA